MAQPHRGTSLGLRKDVLTPASPGTDPEGIVLGEGSQSQEDKGCQAPGSLNPQRESRWWSQGPHAPWGQTCGSV